MSVPPPLHELEAEIMDEVWARDACTVRDVLDALNARSPTPRAYTTVMTVMQRLDGKRLLQRERDGRRDVYVAALSRDEYAQARAGAQVGALVDEYGDVALAHFARHMSQLDPKRREQIRRLAGGD
ncbi:MAG TPA: BlaI/MecI/CopY family transcriptional regulator [Solirubrobacteraceae bacterium]|nr:BlaI/MecI/CopY family transcriptional regulator [Solirubrobacteraceae bacterium]